MTIDVPDEQRAAFVKLLDEIPPHLHDIKLGIDHAEWGAVEKAQLADLLLHYEHRFSRDKTYLGHSGAEYCPTFHIRCRKQ